MTPEERAIWERLAAEQPIEDLMATPLGWDAWQRVKSDAASRIEIVRKDGQPVALAALAPATPPSWHTLFARQLSSAGDLHWRCRYPITGRDVSGGVRALLDQLAHERDWDVLVLGPMLADSETLHALIDAGRERGMRPLVDETGRAPRVVFQGTWQEFYAQRSADLRAAVARGQRRLAKLGPVVLDEVRGGPDLDEALAAFYAIEASGWKGEDGTAIACDPILRARYTELAHDAAAAGQLRLFLLRAGEHVIAGDFCIEHAHDVFGLKTGYDAAHAKASPGQVLHALVLEKLWGSGKVHGYDFMPGEVHAGHKERWANDVRSYAEVRLYRPHSARGQLLAQLVRIKRAIDGAIDARRESHA